MKFIRYTADTTSDSVNGNTAGRFPPDEFKAVGQLNVRLDGNGRLWLTGPAERALPCGRTGGCLRSEAPRCSTER